MSDTKFDFPTEIIDLPSKGLVYPEGHPLRKGNIEIKYMTAREEDILTNQNYTLNKNKDNLYTLQDFLISYIDDL